MRSVSILFLSPEFEEVPVDKRKRSMHEPREGLMRMEDISVCYPSFLPFPVTVVYLRFGDGDGYLLDIPFEKFKSFIDVHNELTGRIGEQ